MNKQQQELYEKLIKKVNEYCLGYAAEDVIAAIDDLVESYECTGQTPSEALNAIKEQMPKYDEVGTVEVSKADIRSIETALGIIYNSQDIMGGHDDFWKAYRIVEKSLKAFRLIIDRRCDIHYIGTFIIINHELEMSKDETKFVEDALNESTN